MRKSVVFISALFVLFQFAFYAVSCKNAHENAWQSNVRNQELKTYAEKSNEVGRFTYSRTYQSDGVDLILIKDKETQNEYLCVKVTHGCAIIKLEQ